MQTPMDSFIEPTELELPLELRFAMRKAELQASEMTWDQLHMALLNLYHQRLVEITAIKDILAEEGVNIEFDIPSEIELENLADICSSNHGDDEEDEDDDEGGEECLQPF
jgi:hypothetical protein